MKIINIKSKTTKELINHYKQIFRTYGYFNLIFADNQSFDSLSLKNLENLTMKLCLGVQLKLDYYWYYTT